MVLYAVKRIDNASGTAVAVIVVEARDPEAFSEDMLKNELQFSSEDFGKMVDTLRDHIPEPSEVEGLQL
ncbi:hypothetical protein [Pelagibacterium sediminicola]|uniref:hypothetical protein n=1 Tax=Pelagibacterium sediminicola TaxID=2248761 RepID=UPI001300A92B|nr:hypothetical protein [Pelagibacterium sediminicola]